MKPWTRWQDWVALVAGLYAALCSIWTNTNTVGMTALIVLGVLMIAAALVNLARPGMMAMEWTEAVLGGLMFISPWVLSFSNLTGAATAAWVVGIISVAVGLWAAVPEVTKSHHHHAATT